MKKPQAYFLIIVLFFVGFLFFFSSPEKEKKENPENSNQEVKQETPAEVFSLAGVISEVNEEENYLLVKRSGEEKTIKAILNDQTEVILLKFPFDLKSPPKEASFVPDKISITTGDLEEGDNVLIEADINIYDKAEFDNVSRVQVLP